MHSMYQTLGLRPAPRQQVSSEHTKVMFVAEENRVISASYQPRALTKLQVVLGYRLGFVFLCLFMSEMVDKRSMRWRIEAL